MFLMNKINFLFISIWPMIYYIIIVSFYLAFAK